MGKSRNTANTTTYNSDFPAPHSRQVTTPATRCVHPSAYRTCRVAGFAPCMPWYALLVRTWACYSEPGQPRPRTEQTAHVRNSGFTCGTRWNPGHCRTQPIHDGSWGSHTQTRDAAFTGTRQTRTPTTATFPRNTTDKSPPQQHDVSILRLIGHVVLLGSHLACLGTPFSSARGPAIPSLGNPAHVRNRRPTCETAGSHAGRVGTQVTVAHSQSMTDHGAATHRPATHHSQEHGKHDHLQQRLSRATKPKSHPASNTFCPSS